MSNEIYAIATLGGPERNVERIGTFIAWIISNNLLETILTRKASSSVARVQMQDLNGLEFLTTVFFFFFKAGHLSEEGQKFAEHYFLKGQYDKDYDACGYDGDDNWLRYDAVAPKISAAYRQFINPKSRIKARLAKIIQFPSKAR